MCLKNQIHSTAIIGPEVSLGFGNTIGPYTVILGRVIIGDNNWIGPHVAIGSPPEHREIRNSPDFKLTGKIDIGSGNFIHEFTSIQLPIELCTSIGNNNFIMNKAHIGHDCKIEDNVTISSGALIGGHVVIKDSANIGLGAIIRQRLNISTFCMVGMGSVITKNHPPYSTLVGVPAKVANVNVIGLGRAGIHMSDSQLSILSNIITDKDLSSIRSLPPVMVQPLIEFFL